MKRILFAIAAIGVTSAPVWAQEFVIRETRVGSSRTTEIVPQGPVVVEHQYVSDEPPAKTPEAKPDSPKPVVGDPKAPPAAKPAPPADPHNPQRVGVAPAPARSGELELRDAINESYLNHAATIRALNPSFAIAPVIGRSAASGGSFYIRASGMPVVRVPTTVPAGADPRYYQSGYYSPAENVGALIPALSLPRPVVLGGYYDWAAYPDWLYSGTIQVDVPRVTTEDVNIAALREEVRQLRLQLEELKKRNAPK